MPIPPGLYIINSKVERNPVIGTHEGGGEDFERNRVVILPGGVKPPLWVVEEHGRHNLLRLDDTNKFAGNIDNKVFAEHKLKEWLIEPQPQYGHENAYIVLEPREPGHGWVVPEDVPYTQIIVRPLIVHPSEPPKYPLNELFDFVRVERD